MTLSHRINGRLYAANEAEQPSVEKLGEQLAGDEDVVTIDGCMGGIEPDGYCEHDQPSWLMFLGYI